jgi:hypothetical protein
VLNFIKYTIGLPFLFILTISGIFFLLLAFLGDLITDREFITTTSVLIEIVDLWRPLIDD